MKIPFTKMQAIGNDFIVINQIDQSYNLSQAQIAKLADRHFGIGFDQLLIIEKSDNPAAFDYKYRIFNADGSEVEHCGNGARCFYEYIQHHKISSKNPITAETLNGSISLTKDDELIAVDMGTFSIGMKNEQSLFFDIFYTLIYFSSNLISSPSPFNSCIRTLNDSGSPGSGRFSPFTIDSYVLALPITSSDFTVNIS